MFQVTGVLPKIIIIIKLENCSNNYIINSTSLFKFNINDDELFHPHGWSRGGFRLLFAVWG